MLYARNWSILAMTELVDLHAKPVEKRNELSSSRAGNRPSSQVQQTDKWVANNLIIANCERRELSSAF